MIRYLVFTIAIITGLLCTGDVKSETFEKESEAIAILDKANQAISALHGISYQAEYLGAFTARGRVASNVLLQRLAGTDEIMQTIDYSARIEVNAIDPPYAQQHYPRAYTVVETGGKTLLIEPAGETFEKTSGLDRRRLNYGALTSAVLPQYLRENPLGFEIEDSIAASYLGTAFVGNVESHVIWLKFEDSSGFGEQLLYFGVNDYLLRKATLVMPETRLPGNAGDAVATNPSMYIDLEMNDLELMTVVPDSAFDPDIKNYRDVLASRERPAVGERGPDWTLQLPGSGTISSQDVLGKVTVLYFWASWCPTCHRFMPAVQDIHDSFSDSVQVLAVNTFDRNDAMAHIRERGYTFPVALGGDELLAERFQLIGQPAMVVLDRDGFIRHISLAEDPADPALWTLLRNLE